MLGKAEQEFGTVKSVLPAGMQQKGGSLIDTANDKVASARSLLNGGKSAEA